MIRVVIVSIARMWPCKFFFRGKYRIYVNIDEIGWQKSTIVLTLDKVSPTCCSLFCLLWYLNCQCNVCAIDVWFFPMNDMLLQKGVYFGCCVNHLVVIIISLIRFLYPRLGWLWRRFISICSKINTSPLELCTFFGALYLLWSSNLKYVVYEIP